MSYRCGGARDWAGIEDSWAQTSSAEKKVSFSSLTSTQKSVVRTASSSAPVGFKQISHSRREGSSSSWLCVASAL